MDLFYGDELDLRDEIGREEREEVAKQVCISDCAFRFSCLEYAILNNEKWGVWGGMSPGDRREFKSFLRSEGYKDLPNTAELRLNVHIWEETDGDYGARPVHDRDGSRHAALRYSCLDDQADRDPARDSQAQAS